MAHSKKILSKKNVVLLPMLIALTAVVAGSPTQSAAIDESLIDKWNAQAWEYGFDYIFIIKKPETATVYTVKAVSDESAGSAGDSNEAAVSSEVIGDPIEKAVDDVLEYADFADEDEFRIRVLAPEAGEILRPGGTGYPIRWIASGSDTEGYVELFYSLDKGKTWERIPTRYKPNTSGSYNWDVPFLVMTALQAQIRVSWLQSEDSEEAVATAESPEFIIEEYFPPYFRESPAKQRERAPFLCSLEDPLQMKKDLSYGVHQQNAFLSEAAAIAGDAASFHFSAVCAVNSNSILPISFEEVMRP